MSHKTSKIHPMPTTGNSKENNETIVTINEPDRIPDWRCVTIACIDMYYEGRKVRKLKKILRCISSTIVLLLSSLLYGLLTLLIVRNRGLRYEEMVTDILISLPIGFGLIVFVFYISKCICCPKSEVTLIGAFYK